EQKKIAEANLADFVGEEITGLADNSLRAVRSAWLNWMAFCRANGVPFLPITFPHLKRFLSQMVDAGRKRATLEQHIYALRRASMLYGCPDPMATPAAKSWWKDLCRKRVRARQKQAA